MKGNLLHQQRLVSGCVIDIYVHPKSPVGYVFDIYTDKAEGWDKSFISRCGEYLTTIPIPSYCLYGMYCPFPQDKAIMSVIEKMGRRFLNINRNLIFELDSLSISQDFLRFASPEAMYFDVSFFMVGADREIEDILYPPQFSRFFFWRDPWEWFLAQTSYNFAAMISRDHPGLLVAANTPQEFDGFRERFIEVFSEEGP